jgi:hypothetical protein
MRPTGLSGSVPVAFQAGHAGSIPVIRSAGHRALEFGHNLLGMVAVLKVMQDREREQAHRPLEVDQRAHDRIRQDLCGIADITGDEVCRPRVGEQCLAVRIHHRVIAGVHDMDSRVEFVRDLAHVPLSGQPRPKVKELGDARLGYQVPHRPAQEPPVGFSPHRAAGAKRKTLPTNSRSAAKLSLPPSNAS